MSTEETRDTDPVDGEDEERNWSPLLSPFIPLLLLALVVTGWFAFETTQLLRERESLRTTRAAQEKNVLESTKLRRTVESITRGTLELANNGNAGARLIVDELKRRGITINANPTSPPPTTK